MTSTITSPIGIWSRPSVDGKVAPLRSAHSSVLLNNSIIAVFGGWDGHSVLDDLVFYQIELNSWLFLDNIKGIKPLKRAGHTGTLLPSSLFGESFLLFGGSDGERYLSDLHIYNYEKNEWREIQTTGIKPSARSRHSAILIPNSNKIYIYGGSDLNNTFNSLYILDLETMKWSIPNCSGDNPPCSWGHTSTFYNNCIYFFGGNNGSGSLLNQINILDLSNHSWKVNCQIESIGPAPSPRLGHSFLSFKNIFILLGGSSCDNIDNKILNDCFIFYPEIMTWRHFSGDNPPLQRHAHSSVLLNNNGLLFLYGGTDGSRFFKDIYILDVEKVLLKLENTPKKRIRLRPLKKSNDQQQQQQQQPQLINNNNNNNLASIISNSINNNNSKNSSTSTTPSLSPLPSNTLNNIIPSSQQQQHLINTTTNNNNNNNNNKSYNNNYNHHNKSNSNNNGNLNSNHNNNNNNNNNNNISERFKGIVEWLTKLGLEKYQDNFILNDITLENLDCLTERHLIEDLCIPTLGARLKILKNIALQKPKENKDEKEILQESISSLKSITDNLALTLTSLNLTIQNLSLNNNNSNNSTPPFNNNNNNNYNNHNNNSSNNGKTRRNSQY